MYRYGCEDEYAAEQRRRLLVRRSVVLGERRLAASRGLAGKRQHTAAAESTIVTGTTTGQQQVTVQQSARLAAIKSTHARYCVSPGPLVICSGSSVFAVYCRLAGSTCRSFAVGTRLLLRVHARGICLPARIRPSSPARLHLLVYRTARREHMSHCGLNPAC